MDVNKFIRDSRFFFFFFFPDLPSICGEMFGDRSVGDVDNDLIGDRTGDLERDREITFVGVLGGERFDDRLIDRLEDK